MSNMFSDAKTEVELLGQMVGAGSVCWENMSGTGVFQHDKARKVAEDGLERLKEIRTGELCDTLSRSLITNEQSQQLVKKMEQTRVREYGLWFFGRKIVGGGFTFRGRTFYWGTHRSKTTHGKRYSVWVRP